MKSKYKSTRVCILTAGRGMRLGDLGKIINKSLLPYKGKAIIDHIIEKYDNQTEFVIALGYLGDQVKNYLKLAHPKLKVRYIVVPNWQGRGSGPGTSILACEEELQSPFFLYVCDGFWDSKINDYKNNVVDVGFSGSDLSDYCNFQARNGVVTKIFNKIKTPKSKDIFTFTGHAFIKNYKVFFKAIKNSKKLIEDESQLINGFYPMISKGILKINSSNWIDLGTLENYQKAIGESERYNFSKVDEFFYYTGKTIIKFFADPNTTRDRYERILQNPSVFPRKLKIQGQFYAYEYQEGKTFYEVGTPEMLSQFLSWAEKKLWLPKSIDDDSFRLLCQKFYHQKTLERILLYQNKFRNDDKISIINSKKIPSIDLIFKKINWDEIKTGIPCFFHGDLQFENFIVTKNSFVMIDWRQNFAGSIEVGDKYYDLAKLLGGIWLQYDLIKKGDFKVICSDNSVRFDFARRISFQEMELVLKDFVLKNNLNWKKVQTITGLIYLNMAPLHHEPFSRLLFFLGKHVLWSVYKNEDY